MRFRVQTCLYWIITVAELWSTQLSTEVNWPVQKENFKTSEAQNKNLFCQQQHLVERRKGFALSEYFEARGAGNWKMNIQK